MRESYLKGMIGCKRAHIKCLQKAFDQGLGSLLIFEDDAVLESGWRECLQAGLSVLPPGWLQLYFSASTYGDARYFSPHLETLGFSTSNTATLYSRDGIEAALKAAKKARLEIDGWFASHLHPFGLSFVLRPQITVQEGSMSDIVRVNRGRTA